MRNNNNHATVAGLVFIILFGSVFSGFGLFWTIMVWRTTHTPMAFFGLIFVAVGLYLIASNIYNFIRAKTNGSDDAGTEENDGSRFPSFTDKADFPYSDNTTMPRNESSFCPFCGSPVAGDYGFCNKCGKKLP